MPIDYKATSEFSAAGAITGAELWNVTQSGATVSLDFDTFFSWIESEDWTPTGTWDFSAATITGDLVLAERADHASTPAAGFGYLWVKSDTPSSLIFTDDTGTDYDLTAPGGSGDMVLASVQTVTGAKTFADGKFLLRNVADTFSGKFACALTATRTWTLPDSDGTIVLGGGTASGTNTGDDKLKTSTGPTTMTVGAVADGEYLMRSGSTIIGATPSGGSSPTYKKLTSTFSTTSTSYADVTGLTFTVAANTAYRLEVFGKASSNATGDAIMIGINGPAYPTSISGVVHVNQLGLNGQYLYAIDAYDIAPVIVFGPGSTANAGFHAVFLLENGANAGTLALRLRSEVGSTTSILTNSSGLLTVVTAA